MSNLSHAGEIWRGFKKLKTMNTHTFRDFDPESQGQLQGMRFLDLDQIGYNGIQNGDQNPFESVRTSGGFSKDNLFPNGMNFNSYPNENPFASSPLSKNGTDLKNNFFLGSKLYNYGNIEIIVDSSSKQNPADKIKIIEQNFIIESKGGNRQLDEGEKGFKVKLFICKDSNQLKKIFDDATIIPDKNEILLFLEDNSGDWSGTTMFIKKGSNANNSNFFDKLFSKNSEFSSFINSNYSISKSDLQELLRKDKVESNALNLISSLFGAVSYLVSSPILIKSIAFGLETAIESIKKNCSISEKSWNPANTENGNVFQPLFFIGIPTILDNIDDSKINAYLKDAVKKLKTESNSYHEIIE